MPTRERPRSLVRMLNSLFALADDPGALEVVLYVDEDDKDTLALNLSSWNATRIVGPRETMGSLNAACYTHSRGEIVVLGNDDVVVRTRGWDTRIRDVVARFADQVYLLYPNDLHKCHKISTFPVLSRVTCNAIGDIFPAHYRGAFIDVHVMDIFKRLRGLGHDRVVYLEDVHFEHMHYLTGKSEFDATYRERDRFGDDRTFVALNDARGWAVARLNAIIAGTGTGPQDPLELSKPLGGWFLNLTWGLLFRGSSPMRWRLRLFVWLWLRFLYRLARSATRSVSRK